MGVVTVTMTAGDALTRALDQLARRPLRNALGKAVQWAVEDGIIRPLANQGRIVVAPGQPISSGWGNAVWDQSVQCFLNAADRTAQFPTPHKGAMWYLEQENQIQWFDGTKIHLFTESDYGATYIRGTNTICNTDGAGHFTLNHGLPRAAQWATVFCGDKASAGQPWYAGQVACGAATIEGYAYFANGSAVPSKTLRCVWAAGC